MKYFAVFFFTLLSAIGFSQETTPTFPQRVSGYIYNDNSKEPIPNVNVINTNKVRGAMSDAKGYFEIDVQVNDTLHFSILGFQSLRIRVTNDWVKNKVTRIQLTEKAIALEEVVIAPFHLTGYLEVDSKLIPTKENYRYSISGLTQGYEAGEYSPNAFGKVLGSIFNPADMLYNFFGKNGRELKKLKEMRKDDTVRNLLESKYDRETVAVLLGISKDEIPQILERCSYSEAFIQEANDLQIMDAISACYEQYKVLKRN
ncbi:MULTISPECIES: carboxypeptidase-like regulatory domain-containing protein [Flavobacterium]|uniref:carboxypeptidase-like regulatory domain-containing protein n=1 Tax=Flavobacterium TaxID=237 RepID=UPI001CBFDDF2|nr:MULTISPECIES: carboxypeptidase-like regulatory domain-containing protein [Flavobacterium]MBZ4043926.1 carboxypeptidase-like regulatory domain-containing protein [Flavobacterium hibisci]